MRFEGLKKRLQKWLEIEETYDYITEDIKDKVLFELSFMDKLALSEQDNSKLYFCCFQYFSKEKVNTVFIKTRFYRASSKNEAMGAFIKYLEEQEVTPEAIASKWDPHVREIDPDLFIDVREDA